MKRHPPRRAPLSRLTRRILLINFLALGIFVGGLFYLGSFREGLLDARIDALTVQAELIAGALGEAAVVGPVDKRELEEAVIKQVLRRTMGTTGSRARLFDQTGSLVVDSRNLVAAGRQVEVEDLPPPEMGFSVRGLFWDMLDRLVGILPQRRNYSVYTERSVQSARDYGEVAAALQGDQSSVVRVNSSGRLVISVAVPVQSFKHVLGALMLTRDSRDIDAAVWSERVNTLKIFAFALAIAAFLSLVLAGTIARPIRRLAAAAESVRTVKGDQVAIPDLSNRRDEIGELSGALNMMTKALFARMRATEAFAADVAHELKNPLTSLRSAIDAFARTDDPNKQEQLARIAQDDVTRLNRLITDISDASRLDAEMSRSDMEVIDIVEMLMTIADVMQSTRSGDGRRVTVDLSANKKLQVVGISSRLGQVVSNLIDNAMTFSAPDGEVRLGARRDANHVVFWVDDDGPGVPEDNLETIFERFYTERPMAEEFGTHSGLGLSISRQIVEAHGGQIWAENRSDQRGNVVGARFVVSLPTLAAGN